MGIWPSHLYVDLLNTRVSSMKTWLFRVAVKEFKLTNYFWDELEHCLHPQNSTPHRSSAPSSLKAKWNPRSHALKSSGEPFQNNEADMKHIRVWWSGVGQVSTNIWPGSVLYTFVFKKRKDDAMWLHEDVQWKVFPPHRGFVCRWSVITVMMTLRRTILKVRYVTM